MPAPTAKQRAEIRRIADKKKKGKPTITVTDTVNRSLTGSALIDVL